MADILQTTFFKCIFFNENHCILIQISPEFVPKGPYNNMSSLPKPMLTKIYHAMWDYSATVS